METILPETDKIKASVDELHNVKAHKLAYRKYQDFDGQRDDIAVSNLGNIFLNFVKILKYLYLYIFSTRLLWSSLVLTLWKILMNA